jgi:hypothetical protein
MYSIWLEKKGLQYLEDHRENQTSENLVNFLDEKGGYLAPMFLAHFGIARVVKELEQKIQELA